MLNLILKDLRVQKNKLLSFLAITLFNMWFVLVYEPEGDAFLKMCIGLMAFLVAFLTVDEVKNKSSILSYSLPVKRATIVVARYFSSFLIVVVGLQLWFVYALILDILFPGAGIDLGEVASIRVIGYYLVILSLFISLFYPPLFRLGTLKGLLVSVAVLFILFHLSYKAAQRMRASDGLMENAVAYLGTPVGLGLLGVFTITCVSASAWLSVRFYAHRDL